MPFYSMQVTIGRATNVPADATVNNWSCQALDVAGLALFAQNVVDFYRPLGGLFSNLVRQTNHTFKCYDRADPEPRVPVLSGSFNLIAAPGGAPLPAEVALVLSFQGEPISGVPQARRRGRIYFGPLAASNNGTDGRPTTTAINALRSGMIALKTASDASANWIWTVHSRTSEEDAAVADGWINNEWDTQRSRGVEATTRNVWP